MTNDMKYRAIGLAASFAVVLSACGGGGGERGSPSPPVSTNPTPPVVTSPPATPEQDLQTSVPIPTYAANSEELAFFNAYNEFRSQAGLGKLAQNTKLDLAAKNHLNYQAQNLDLDLFATDPATCRVPFDRKRV
ncbi:hypothetical protein MasN3_36800 [Massilia varians]|uniref:Lipoprotein n=1 Tax=Massilia varians TaxID=457921 RepID=A0ABM8CA75_9BURK|nr:CAP domain-containing protein [Massilia varians]BDT60186.1 hypothetical protein MasN3_36800 [Massilia varians]